ncbi:MAG TPA: hypothetical protein VHM27_14135 [Rhizomicrobium sp.]|nr:hypothetical protein [Rhizomicrobium sp.]
MPFETVAEALLKGGIAPRHVRRYIGELTDHLQDAIAQQKAAGYSDEDARIRARALLGDDRELTAAMLEQTRFRSWPARLPWLVFVVAPFFVLTLASMGLLIPIFAIGDGAQHVHNVTGIPPDFLRQLSWVLLTGLNLLALPALALGLGALAHRQRLNPLWPVAGIMLLLPLFLHVGMAFGDPALHRPGSLRATLAPPFTAQFPQVFADQAPVMIGQGLLTLLVITYLLRRRTA